MPGRADITTARRRLQGVMAAMLLCGAGGLAAQPAPGQLAGQSAEQQRAELNKLQDYVAEASARLAQLQQLLSDAEQRNQQQSQLINRLERELSEQRARDPRRQQQLRADFFSGLFSLLPLSPLYRVHADRLTIAADPVFVFGTGEIGAEGRERLQALADALREMAAQIPQDASWRLRIEGHTDIRPLRGNARFASNWELSAARAVEMLRYLLDQGFEPARLSAVALAATRPVNAADSKAAHRQNRRIEIHIHFDPAS